MYRPTDRMQFANHSMELSLSKLIMRGDVTARVLYGSRDDDGVVLESQVVRTDVRRSGGSQTKLRVRNLALARRKGELALPKFLV